MAIPHLTLLVETGVNAQGASCLSTGNPPFLSQFSPLGPRNLGIWVYPAPTFLVPSRQHHPHDVLMASVGCSRGLVACSASNPNPNLL